MVEMTVDGILAEVERIKSLVGDPEEAHCVEDSLYIKILRHVATSGPVDLAALATAALTANDLDYTRWYS